MSNGQGSSFSAATLIALAAIVIALAALVLAALQARTLTAQQDHAVWPHIQIARSLSQEPLAIEWVAVSSGMGPAKVEWYGLKVDGNLVESWDRAIRSLLGENVELPYGMSLLTGRTIPRGERTLLFRTLDNEDLTRALIRASDRIELEICYCALTGDCWTASSRRYGVVTPVNQCPTEGSLPGPQ